MESDEEKEGRTMIDLTGEENKIFWISKDGKKRLVLDLTADEEMYSSTEELDEEEFIDPDDYDRGDFDEWVERRAYSFWQQQAAFMQDPSDLPVSWQAQQRDPVHNNNNLPPKKQ